MSLDVPKPLFPVAGLPIVQHHIEACSKVRHESAGQQPHSLLQVPDIKEVLLLGFYPASEMASFVADMNREHQQVCMTSPQTKNKESCVKIISVSGVSAVLARICTSGYSWRSSPLPRPDQSRKSRRLYRYEWRCLR